MNPNPTYPYATPNASVQTPFTPVVDRKDAYPQVAMNAATLANIAHLGEFGTNLASRGQEYAAISNSYFHQLCFHFAVTTSYVKNKTKLLIFPYNAQNWRRQKQGQQYGQNESAASGYMKPQFDVNCPDLYIPSMSFVSFLLLVAWLLGSSSRFQPDILGHSASIMMFMLAFEIGLTKLVLYILNFPHRFTSLELLCYFGYKYFGMTIVLISDILLGSLGFYAATTWTSASLAYFLMQSIRAELAIPSDSTGQKLANHVVFLIGVSQVVFSWIGLWSSDVI
eukprot:TRINITY_DN2786_c0_g1_i1.p1 TRINITY_DN2786_c0_g1~~TRINITY_DN2786_c0_g1_i1.p1  ORF type:complete len:281 (-),score=62.38 TRINITY_DN2786_c0_g1_i1:124-966(-)